MLLTQMIVVILMGQLERLRTDPQAITHILAPTTVPEIETDLLETIRNRVRTTEMEMETGTRQPMNAAADLNVETRTVSVHIPTRNHITQIANSESIAEARIANLTIQTDGTLWEIEGKIQHYHSRHPVKLAALDQSATKRTRAPSPMTSHRDKGTMAREATMARETASTARQR